jgi:GGDEF domain-containing protein
MSASSHEFVIWGALVGGLVTLLVQALAAWWADGRSLGAWRNVVFLLLMGSAALVVAGLPEVLWPALDGRVLHSLKAGLGPLAASVTLFYLGQWMGGMREDRLLARTSFWGAAALLISTLVLTLAGLLLPAAHFRSVFLTAAAVTLAAVALGFAVALRAALRGDRLARGMALAAALLAGMTLGLYLHGLKMRGLGLGSQFTTVALTLGFFILVSTLVARRNHEVRRLARLARIEPGVEPATQLPTGSHLVRQVEDALWSAARRHARVGVVCLYLDNLYEALDDSDPSSEYQILVAMAARIRRAAGFRCVVGVYEPRCFMVVITLTRDQRTFEATLTRLRAYVREAIEVLDPERPPRRFSPRVGVGVALADAANAVARELLDEAERQARANVPEEQLQTRY